ncbi:unnamed protein product [Spirodela intermedia]|uniref:Uncharacterized protein n=2 Tax=Spirodela intermedia TaxID=51605 RepID=A0A7I8K9N7_SPIIN|nr:unnamed protein product [Spirodela intermedia]CAA6658244.1 unnamed protein product [Spirodela intermedia]CAA7394431.1 unnamed protein product [Spirodela intermedia]
MSNSRSDVLYQDLCASDATIATVGLAITFRALMAATCALDLTTTITLPLDLKRITRYI